MSATGQRTERTSAPSFTTVRNDDTAPDQIFGIELEFLYMCRNKREPIGIIHGVQSSNIGANAVRAVLSEDIRGHCRTCKNSFTFRLPLDPGHEAEQWLDESNDEEGENYRLWSVTSESLHPEKESDLLCEHIGTKYLVSGVEVKSRVLSLSTDIIISAPGSSHQHQKSAREEISAVLQHLRGRLTSFENDQQESYIYANEGCGLHVHVGNYDRSFDVDTIKKLVCFNIACERLIDQIHSPHRVDGYEATVRPLDYSGDPDFTRDTWSMNDAFNRPLSSGFLYRAYCRRRAEKDTYYQHTDQATLGNRYTFPRSHLHDKTIHLASISKGIDSWMYLVREAPLLVDIMQNLYPLNSRNTIVNLKNLTNPFNVAKKKKLTVEFRQHAGTLQTDRVLAQVDFVTRMVNFCQISSWIDVRNLIDSDGPLRQADATILLLCTTIGFSRTTLSYYTDCSNQSYTKAIRHQECKQAQKASKAGNLLADVAVNAIEQERTHLDPSNRRQAVAEKLQFGGYGLFPRDLAKQLLGPKADDAVVERITLGFDSEIQPNRRNYSPSAYAFSKKYSVPSAGSSLTTSPLISPGSGTSESRGRQHERGIERNSSSSPLALSGVSKEEQTPGRHISPAAGLPDRSRKSLGE
ncbi:uncharacterized protein LTR77_000580 [Saxophila tyrrhenica]|uniref:Uncharacterized protein n=1 Tax=Saxophila tyrrhenica TaxID=1690608 RepID=A0AAV9PNR6_9PEZI|nr:hypothetical protein LTR77_000580 [Saxophila tyrrhenica]